MDKDHWLSRVLADVETGRAGIDLRQSMYGAADIAAKYCGFDSPPTELPGQWQHGWKAPHRQLTAQYEMGELEPLVPEENYWVARKDQEKCLKLAGLHKAKAIGLPCVYLPEAEVARRKNSLLVMPAHSLDYTRHDWKFEEYADQIFSIRKDFDEVIACVHKSCFDRGLWVDSFRKRKIPVVVGAHTSDPLTLYRQQAMLSSFGFVTTNSHGSHIAYAAFWGARVSIFGTYADLRAEDFFNTPFYQRYPDLVRPAVEAINEPAMREHYPQLFADHPRDANDLKEWGAIELGADNRLSPKELQQTFSWRWSDRVSDRLTRVVKKIGQAIIPRKLRKRLERSPAERERIQLDREISAIQSSSSGQKMAGYLLGHEFHFIDGQSCAALARLVFDQQVFRFHTANPRPRIIDVGADIGLVTIYMARLHPKSSILSIEPNREAFELLEKNCLSFSLLDVDLQSECVTNLTSLLEGPVDFLHLNVGGNEAAMLLECREKLVNVERICIRYRGSFNENQRLSALFAILEESGYRIHIHSLHPAPQPLVHRPVVDGCDQHLFVFAVRETKPG